MAGLRIAVVFIACMLALATASPIFFKPKHEHVIIHVPYKVHTHHHHHIEKVHVPVIKHVPVYKTIYKEIPVHYDHHDHHDHHDHGWDNGWW